MLLGAYRDHRDYDVVFGQVGSRRARLMVDRDGRLHSAALGPGMAAGGGDCPRKRPSTRASQPWFARRSTRSSWALTESRNRCCTCPARRFCGRSIAGELDRERARRGSQPDGPTIAETKKEGQENSNSSGFAPRREASVLRHRLQAWSSGGRGTGGAFCWPKTIGCGSHKLTVAFELGCTCSKARL